MEDSNLIPTKNIIVNWKFIESWGEMKLRNELSIFAIEL